MKRLICWLFGHQPKLTDWERLPPFWSRHCSGTRWARVMNCSRCGKRLHTDRTHRHRKPAEAAR